MFLPLHDEITLKHINLQYVTLGIIAINLIIWLVQATPTFLSPDTVQAQMISFGFIPAVVNDIRELPPQLVRIPEDFSYITYAFLHGDFMHVAGNMLFLWVFGDNVEDAMGHLKFLAFYLLCAAAGAFGHSLLDPASASPLIGASGAAAGVTIAYLVLHPRVNLWVLALGRIPLRISAMWAIGAWIGFQVFSILSSSGDNVSYAAHIGGILAGAVLIFVFKRPGVLLFDRSLGVEPLSKATPVSGGSVPDIKPKAEKEKRSWGRQNKAD